MYVLLYSCSRSTISVMDRATAAGDKQVRVFDINEVHRATPDGQETLYSTQQSCTHLLRCHEHRVKRIVTEHSPDLFLSVGEVRCRHCLQTSLSLTL